MARTARTGKDVEQYNNKRKHLHNNLQFVCDSIIYYGNNTPLPEAWKTKIRQRYIKEALKIEYALQKDRCDLPIFPDVYFGETDCADKLIV